VEGRPVFRAFLFHQRLQDRGGFSGLSGGRCHQAHTALSLLDKSRSVDPSLNIGRSGLVAMRTTGTR
jgi:hypothetical protein